MRLSLGVALALAGGEFISVGAYGQNSNAIAVPPPPPIMAAPSQPVAPVQAMPEPPGLVQTPMPPANTDNGAPPVDNGSPTAPSSAAATNSAAAATGTPPATAMPMTNDWTPGKTAEIGVLDRVDGGIANLQIPVGGHVTSGDLQISVLACVMRPDNEIPDAAIFVNVQSTAQATTNNAGAPIFHGWMVRSIPAATVVGDSSETLRVANCT